MNSTNYWFSYIFLYNLFMLLLHHVLSYSLNIEHMGLVQLSDKRIRKITKPTNLWSLFLSFFIFGSKQQNIEYSANLKRRKKKIFSGFHLVLFFFLLTCKQSFKIYRPQTLLHNTTSKPLCFLLCLYIVRFWLYSVCP